MEVLILSSSLMLITGLIYLLIIPILLYRNNGQRKSSRSLRPVYLHGLLLLLWTISFLLYQADLTLRWNLMTYLYTAVWLTGTLSFFIHMRRQKPPVVKWYLRLWILLSLPLSFPMYASLFLLETEVASSPHFLLLNETYRSFLAEKKGPFKKPLGNTTDIIRKRLKYTTDIIHDKVHLFEYPTHHLLFVDGYSRRAGGNYYQLVVTDSMAYTRQHTTGHPLADSIWQAVIDKNKDFSLNFVCGKEVVDVYRENHTFNYNKNNAFDVLVVTQKPSFVEFEWNDTILRCKPEALNKISPAFVLFHRPEQIPTALRSYLLPDVPKQKKP